MVGIDIRLDGIYKKLDQQARDRGQIAMANQIHSDMNQYVPKKSGTLRTSSYVTPKGWYIVYRQKYAAAQFYGKFTRTKPFTPKQLRFLHALARENGGTLPGRGYSEPGTGPRWDLKAAANHMESWKHAYVEGAGIK